MENHPTVSVIVLNYNGLRHLDDCLGSLLDLDYPAAALEILLVDNGSSDNSLEYVRERYPRVRIHAIGQNLGFAAGNNVGASVATGEWLAFLNNDTRVDRAWLRELVGSVLTDAGREVVCTGAKMLDWEGHALDFVGGVMNFHGFGYQLSYGLPLAAEPQRYREKRDMLFACGGSMLIRADIFPAAGGFDADFFANFEDVDLGWRLWVLGYRVTFTPTAITYHRGHGTISSIPDHRRLVLYERNSLFAVYKNYSDAYLAEILPASLLMMSERVVRLLGVTNTDLTEYDLTTRRPARQTLEPVHPQVVSTMLAAEEFNTMLPAFAAKRAAIQAGRRRPDAEIVELFGQPTRIALINHPADAGYARAHMRIMNSLGIADLFAHVPKHVLLISPDVLPVGGIPTSGVGLRAWALGQGLMQRGHHVHFAMPAAALQGREDLVPPEIRELAWTPANLQGLVDALVPDVIVTVGWPNLTPLERAPVPIACDLTGPHLLERDYQDYRDNPTNADEKLAALDRADFFTCIGERQRYYFIPWLAQVGIRAAEMDQALSVIRYSLNPTLPEHHWPPDWSQTPVTFVYGGVFLPWQDPSVGLDTLAETLAEAGRGRLLLFGGKHVFHAVDTGVFEPLMARLQANPQVELAGLRPVEELEAVYTRAHVAMDLMRRNPERELAFASRTVHYLWCGLPVIHSRFSELAALIDQYEAGWTVDPTDAPAIRAIVESILADPAEAARRGANAQRLVRECLTWDRTIDALDAFVRRPYIRESRGAWAAHQRAQAALPVSDGHAPANGIPDAALPAGASGTAAPSASSDSGAVPVDLGVLAGVVARTAAQRRSRLAQVVARGQGLVRPYLPGGRTRPVRHDGTWRYALDELIAGHSLGQRIRAERPNLSGIEIQVATFARLNTGHLTLALYPHPGSSTPLALLTVPVVTLPDGAPLRFRFPPLPDSHSHTYYLSVTSPDSVPGDAVTLWARPGRPGTTGGRYEDGIPAPGALVYRLLYD
jgi:GT2 family glycosyltransferase/glycosyltransferase involved in cell wall biosynthesis